LISRSNIGHSIRDIPSILVKTEPIPILFNIEDNELVFIQHDPEKDTTTKYWSFRLYIQPGKP
jgi:hypothetical protein